MRMYNRIIISLTIMILITFCISFLIPLDNVAAIEITNEKTYETTNIYMKALKLEDAFWVYAVETINISGIEIPGGTTALVITLKNEADYVVQNATVSFNSIKKIAECNETVKHYNDSILPGYAVTFAFTVNVYDNVTASEYDLPLNVQYFANGYQYGYQIMVPVAVTGVPILKVKAYPIYVDSEGVCEFAFKVNNIGTAPARRVIASLIAYPPYVTSYGDDWINLGIIPANKTKIGRFSIYVSKMPTEIIPIVVNVTFMDQRTNNFYSVAESIPVIYNETPRVIVVSSSYTPTTVFPGDKFVKLIITIANPTNKILEDTKAELILPEGFLPSYAGSTSISLGSLIPGQTVTIWFYVNVENDVSPGLKNMHLYVTFSNGQNVFDIPIIVKEKAKFMVTDFSPSTLPVGGRGINFRVSIKNIAKVDAESVYLQLMGGTVLKGEVVTYVGKIVAGEEASVTFVIEISSSAPVGLVSLDLKVTWTQEERILVEIYKIYVTITSGHGISSLVGIIIGVSMIGAGILLIPILKEIKKRRFGGEEA